MAMRLFLQENRLTASGKGRVSIRREEKRRTFLVVRTRIRIPAAGHFHIFRIHNCHSRLTESAFVIFSAFERPRKYHSLFGPTLEVLLKGCKKGGREKNKERETERKTREKERKTWTLKRRKVTETEAGVKRKRGERDCQSNKERDSGRISFYLSPSIKAS